MKLSVRSLLPWLIALVMLLVDQITKHAARVSFSLPDGNPDYFKFHTVIGEWFQFRLVYNFGAAFGMKPQGVLPFLNPTLFYTLFSLAAMVFLGEAYLSEGRVDEADPLFQKALAARPKLVPALFGIGRVQLKEAHRIALAHQLAGDGGRARVERQRRGHALFQHRGLAVLAGLQVELLHQAHVVGGQRRQPLSQIVVSARQPRQGNFRAVGEDHRGPAYPRRARQQPV